MGHYLLVKQLSFFLPLLALITGCAVNVAPRSTATAIALDSEKVAQIDQFIVTEMESRHIAGLSAAVISNGQIRYARGYGLADIDKRKAVDTETTFLIASITKMFTAVGTMKLVEDGKVQLDAKVETYVPNLPLLWRPVTVRQLLNHTSGINSFTSHDTPPCGPVTKDEVKYEKQDVIAEVSCLPLDFASGTNWAYSDTGYFVLGLLIERVSELSYEHYMHQRIFKPIGMNSTRLISPIGMKDNRAVGYHWDGTQFVPSPLLNPVVEGPSGGLVSTVVDLARFDAALGDGRLLPLSVLQTMWKPTEIGTAKYGLGFGVRPINGRKQVGHTGGGPGATTSYARFEDDGITIVVLTNTAQRPQSIQEIIGGIAERAIDLRSRQGT